MSGGFIMSKKMTAEDYLRMEDERFNKEHDDDSNDDNDTFVIPKGTKVAKINVKDVDKMDINDLRNGFLEELVGGGSDQTIMKTAKMEFKKADIIGDLKKIIAKYGLNPNGQVEGEIISTFVRNLYSAKLVKQSFGQ